MSEIEENKKEENQTRVTMDEVYTRACEFLKKYPLTISWRIKQHSKVLAKHLNLGEKLIYIFPAQKNADTFNIYDTCLIGLTNKRIIIAQKNVLWGYQLISVTPDMFNDFEVYKGLIFGKIDIDTVKEVIRLSDVDPRALVELETNLSEYLTKVKPKFTRKEHHEDAK
ncbi:MAG: PH domain-containing protein [Bacilli bacterium]|nr:PH domain-containing protein [Bacilli bacterium]